IRLCSLYPGNFDDPIQCYIKPFNLHPLPKFEALSYTWGNPTDRLPIIANGETMLVTKNLATSLTYLRDCSDARVLWIDAICINQNDLGERSKQVMLMGKIYEVVTRVISWLGIRDPLFDPFIEMHHATSLFQHIRFLKTHPPFQAYLESNNTYWQRAWIIQEVICAKRLIL
ncbi:hypothetical protein TRIATDRAFT_185589, partial [Trichoderma atroviride IMI 206040]